MQTVKKIALTAGEPAGIGPDIIAQFATSTSPHQRIVFTDPELLFSRAKNIGIDLILNEFDSAKAAYPQQANELDYVAIPLSDTVIAGTLDSANANHVLNSIKTATEYCLAGKTDALVTGPIQKSIINDSGLHVHGHFSGHTEYLAELANTQQVVMMLTSENLRVALATTHLPLRDVHLHITQESLTKTLQILHHDMVQRYGITQPRIAVCGLNPHAGEAGHLGDEEINIIEPVIESLCKQGMHLTGPWSADTLFTPNRLSEYDVVLSMYHDQGLPVLKHQGFGNAINVTLGLPFIRTSVDHGTALSLAGTNRASCSSLFAAFNEACSMTLAQTRQEPACV